MSTRFYFSPYTGTPVAVTPSNLWEGLGSGEYNKGRIFAEAIGNSLILTQTGSGPQSGLQDNLHSQFVSDPLPAQTLSGTFSCVIPAGEGSVTYDAWLQVIIRVVSNDGTVQRGVAYAGQTQSTPSATTTDPHYEYVDHQTLLKTRVLENIALTNVTVLKDDRLIVEVGWRSSRTSGTDTHMMFNDRADAEGDLAPVVDVTCSTDPKNPNYLRHRPWIEFSADVFGTLTREQYRYMKGGVLLNGDAPMPFVDVESVDGLDSAPFRIAQNDREGVDGGLVIANFESIRTVTLEGTVYCNPNSIDAYLDLLRYNWQPTKKTYPLFFGGDTELR